MPIHIVVSVQFNVLKLVCPTIYILYKSVIENCLHGYEKLKVVCKWLFTSFIT